MTKHQKEPLLARFQRKIKKPDEMVEFGLGGFESCITKTFLEEINISLQKEEQHELFRTVKELVAYLDLHSLSKYRIFRASHKYDARMRYYGKSFDEFPDMDIMVAAFEELGGGRFYVLASVFKWKPIAFFESALTLEDEKRYTTYHPEASNDSIDFKGIATEYLKQAEGLLES